MAKKIITKTALLFLSALILLPFNSWALDAAEPIRDFQKRAVATNLGLFGGKPEDIAIDPTSQNVYLANFAPSGIYTSNDSGETWQGLPAETNFGTGKAVEVDSLNGDVYALIGDSILKSTDRGVNFKDITANLIPPLGQTMLFAQNKLFVASNRGEVYISYDGGNSFTTKTIENGTMIIALASSPTPGTFYALASTDSLVKLYKSTDDGFTWSPISVPSGSLFSAVGANPLNTNHLLLGSSSGPAYQSYDGGVSWSQIVLSGQGVSGNHVTFDRLGRIYLGLNYSDDGGASWTQFNTDTPFSSIYGDKMAIDSRDERIVFTNSNMGVAKSQDRAISWQDKIAGITSVKTYGVSQARDKNIVWIAANGGLAKTTDFLSDSPTWLYPVPGSDGVEVYAVWVKPEDPNVILFGDHNFIKRSSDGGATWQQVAQAGSGAGGNIYKIVSDRKDSDVLYAAFANDDLSGTDSGAVLKSIDGGKTWQDTALSKNAPAYSLTVAKDGAVYAGTRSRDAEAQKGIFKYENKSWTKLKLGPKDTPVTSVLADPEEAQTIYATIDAAIAGGTKETKSGFYKSRDGGLTWDNISDNEGSGLKNINHLEALTAQTSTTPNTLYLSGQDGKTLNGVIYKSSDAGESWGLFYTGLKQESFYALLFDGLLAGNDRGLYGLKSKAKITIKPSAKRVKRGQKVILRVALKDAATKKKLKNRRLGLVKRVGKKWRLVKVVKTNEAGQALFWAEVKKNTVFQIRFKPKGKSDRAEYILSKSKKIKIKVKK